MKFVFYEMKFCSCRAKTSSVAASATGRLWVGATLADDIRHYGNALSFPSLGPWPFGPRPSLLTALQQHILKNHSSESITVIPGEYTKNAVTRCRKNQLGIVFGDKAVVD